LGENIYSVLSIDVTVVTSFKQISHFIIINGTKT